ncbi:MAG TPA: HDOD domain-containing protein [Geobacteraceae bacterium]|nr:HDOD domain-containing protein [Geobacteraceae bacterium]
MASADFKGPVTLERLVDMTTTVYSLPLFYDRLTEIINHPRCSVTDIARVITEDQGLTARLLKLANSPMFGYYSRIDTINKAVTIIGTQQIRDLALAMSVMEVFTDIPKELINMKSFWRHGIACGIIARALATYRRENNVERYFAAGILHDLGLLVMCTTIPGIVREILVTCSKDGTLCLNGELAHLGFTHAEVGRDLFRKWKIPVSIVEPVACHHAPAMAEQFPLGASIIHLANIICQALELGSSGERFVHPLDPAAWQRLDIPACALSRIVKQVEPQLEEAFAILGENAL